MEIFSKLNKLSQSIYKKFPHSEMYLVGGAVRDLVMGRELGDLDVVVRGVPLNLLIKFLKIQGDAGLVGKNFGVIKFRPKGSDKSLDIALPRTDHAFNTGGYRDVKVAYEHRLPIEKDLERRDFACNAIALKINSKFEIPAFAKRLRTGGRNSKQIRNLKLKIRKTTHYSLLTTHSNLIDPFNGLKDIQIKTIRAVGNPEKRFKEDYTRMLRALRFACQLDFQIEKKTWGSIRKNVKKINSRQTTDNRQQTTKEEYLIARELVAKEFLKGMYHDPVKMLELMERSGLLKELMPELLTLKTCKQDAKWHSEGNVWRHTILALQLAHSFRRSELNSELGNNTPRPIGHPSQEGTIEKSPPRRGAGGFLDPLLTLGITIQETLELYLGILFHDIGKPSTAGHEKKGNRRAITYYGHESVGAQMTRKICGRLKLSAPEEYHVDTNHVVWCVKNHMLLHPENAKQMRNNTLEKYFFNLLVPGKVLLGVSFFDGLASVPKNLHFPLKIRGTKGVMNTHNSPNLSYLKRGINADKLKSWPSLAGWWTTATRLKKLSRGRKELPKPLLNGDEIMKILKIKPGPQVGKIIEALREAQLSGKVRIKEQAMRYIL